MNGIRDGEFTDGAFFSPPTNLLGAFCLSRAIAQICEYGFRRALVVTDNVVRQLGLVDRVTRPLHQAGIRTVLFDRVQANPTVANVHDGVGLLLARRCDVVISVGGGSCHDCAKGIALVATNGGAITDYEGVNRSRRPQLPLVAITTTAGSASEMTRFCVITDVARQLKMTLADRHLIPFLSVSDPVLMLAKPAELSAVTGLDALTHAIEAYVSLAANPITDACALQAIRLICRHLPAIVVHGGDLPTLEQMVYAQFLAGMAFNSASLGYVHAMSHQLGGFYDLPHGLCNAVLLPHVQRFNAGVCAGRLQAVAMAMGVDVSAMDEAEAAAAAVDAMAALIRQLALPTRLADLGVELGDLPLLASNAMQDAYGRTNPRQPTLQQVLELYQAAI